MANEEWKTLRIDEIKADSHNAIAIGPFGSRMKAELYRPYGIPVIRGNNLSTSKQFVKDFVFVSEETANQLQTSVVFPNDLVFPHRGAIGEVGIVPDNGQKKFILSSSLMKLTCNTKLVDPLFLFYFFRSSIGRQELLKNASTVGTPGIATPLSSLRSIEVPVPSLIEQQNIARILGSLDDKIELNRQMNETLEAMARAIFKSWFVDFDPVRAKAEGRDTGLPLEIAALFPDGFEEIDGREVPKGWGVKPLSDSFDVRMGQSPPGTTYNEDGEGISFFQGRTDFGFRYPTVRIFCTAPTRFAEVGDTLVSVRAPVGDINLTTEKCCIGRGVAAVRHKTGSRSFTYYQTLSIKDIFALFESEGTVFGSIAKTDFNSIKCITPPDEIVKKFEEIAFPIDQMIENNEEQSRTLAQMRDALLPKLMSGEISIH